MMNELICIQCPNGCTLRLRLSERGELLRVTGNRCKRGAEYAAQELRDPRRTIATSVLVLDGAAPLCSVRITAPIPRARIQDAVAAIHALRVPAPVAIGDVLAHDLLGLGCDVIATKSIAKAPAL